MTRAKLFTRKQLEKMLKNWDNVDCSQLKPVIKLFTPDANAIWLIVAAHKYEVGDNDYLLYGLCDLGLGYVEWGDVSVEELTKLRVPVERDLYVNFDKTMGEYLEEATGVSFCGSGKLNV